MTRRGDGDSIIGWMDAQGTYVCGKHVTETVSKYVVFYAKKTCAACELEKSVEAQQR